MLMISRDLDSSDKYKIDNDQKRHKVCWVRSANGSIAWSRDKSMWRMERKGSRCALCRCRTCYKCRQQVDNMLESSVATDNHA